MDTAIWIVDGNNFIRRDRRLRELLRRTNWDNATKVLENELLDFRRRQGRGHSVVLVFDGIAAPGTRLRSHKGFRVLRPQNSKEDADLIVLAEAKRHEGRTEVNVVSSDAVDIGNRLRGMQVHWYSVEEFAPLMRPKTRRPRTTGSVTEADVDLDDEKPALPTGADVDRWIECFTAEDDEDDAKRDDGS